MPKQGEKLKNHKYIERIKDGKGYKYFYTLAEYKAYLNKGSKENNRPLSRERNTNNLQKSKVVKRSIISGKNLNKVSKAVNKASKRVNAAKDTVVNKVVSPRLKNTSALKKEARKEAHEFKKSSKKKINTIKSDAVKKVADPLRKVLNSSLSDMKKARNSGILKVSAELRKTNSIGGKPVSEFKTKI